MLAEYIWIDGGNPTARVRSKTKYIHDTTPTTVERLPLWNFDGSSTMQAIGKSSDCVLRPVRIVNDPIRGGDNILVLCEVETVDGDKHPSNTRSKLVKSLESFKGQGEWVAFEQEYTLYKGSRPLGFPSERRFPADQGPYYCGVGADEVSGRPLVEKHLDICLQAGLPITGINAEVMPGQWEYQLGGPNIDALTASDHLWISRWLLYRIGEDFDITATLDPKPVAGDWNGAGMHTNFSTKTMRQEGGIEEINQAVEKMSHRIQEHLDRYGAGYEIRLTGHHETCRYDEFKWGVSDRTASVRVPVETDKNGCGYFEDRRPNANADPYLVCEALIRTISETWE